MMKDGHTQAFKLPCDVHFMSAVVRIALDDQIDPCGSSVKENFAIPGLSIWLKIDK